jgi:hypothetical protein
LIGKNKTQFKKIFLQKIKQKLKKRIKYKTIKINSKLLKTKYVKTHPIIKTNFLLCKVLRKTNKAKRPLYKYKISKNLNIPQIIKLFKFLRITKHTKLSKKRKKHLKINNY